MSDWIILRCSGRHTLALAASLAADGFEVWTPVEEKTIRAGRDRRRVDVRQAILESYVFAKSNRLVDLLEMSKPATSKFSVMHAFGRIPMVADAHLSGLRRIEAKRTVTKRAAYSFPRNASARVNGGVFGGMVGVVVRSTPDRTVLRFTGGFPVEIPTSLLDPDAIQSAQSAARKAA